MNGATTWNTTTAARPYNETWCLSSSFCPDPCGPAPNSTEPMAGIGWAGFGLFSCIALGSLYRFTAACVGRSNRRTKIFYFLVVLCAACEAVSQTALCFCGAPTRYSVPFHLYSEQLLLVSFSIIVAMWSAIICARNRKCVMWAFGILNFVGVTFTAYVCWVALNFGVPFWRGDDCPSIWNTTNFAACAYSIQVVLVAAASPEHDNLPC